MAKRGRSVSLDKLTSQLGALDAQRKVLVAQLQKAVSAWSGESPFPWNKTPKATKGSGKKRGRKKGAKMSAAARKRISDAQKARWVKKKAEK